MGKFVFGLETLLRFREDIERKEKDDLFRRIYNHQMELRRHGELSEKYRETMNGLVREQAERPAAYELSCYFLYLNRLTKEIYDCEQSLKRLQSEVQRQKEAVIEASKKKKTLAILKQKKEKEFFAGEEKRAQKEIDELVAVRHLSK
ncbi:MAG TPA: flagellar export protein FliJ [Acidobacteriota bacterium]|nr:flagellar export protein FliJ [Acidobacteriota bacterium]